MAASGTVGICRGRRRGGVDESGGEGEGDVDERSKLGGEGELLYGVSAHELDRIASVQLEVGPPGLELVLRHRS